MTDEILTSLKAAEVARDFGPWKLVTETSAGGAHALGFDRNSETLLVVSSNGQGVYDCVSGERVYRNRERDGYNHLALAGRRLDDPGAPPFQMSGTYGGGLLKITHDGWTIDSLPLEWPTTFCIVQPPKASIYYLQEKFRQYKADGTYYLVSSFPGLPVAYGFSWSGKTLVWCDRSDLKIWTRTMP